MELFEYYLRYFGELCEGTRPMPDGLGVDAGTEPERIAALQAEILKLGIPEFVRLCAAQDGTQIPEEAYQNFDMSQVLEAAQAMQRMAAAAPEQAAEQAPEEPEQDDRPKIEEPDGPRDACEVLLDCCLLDDNLFSYLMEVLKTGDGLGFFRLSQVTARQAIEPQDFLAWLGNKERLASAEEQACVAIMDDCLARVEREGQKELLAALLSGDQTTFELFRCDAPELQHLPDATYDWYAKYYLDRYYPVRFMMRLHGVKFPTLPLQKTEEADT